MDKVPGLVRGLIDQLVGDVPTRVAGDFLTRPVEDLERGAAVGAAGAGATRLGILGERAPELQHESVNHAVEVDAVVEARLAQVHEVAAGDGELVHEDLGDERALRRFFFFVRYTVSR
jgi:hypothetical protein